MNFSLYRISLTKKWPSRWFAANNKDYADFIFSDHVIRELIYKHMADSIVTKIFISRYASNKKKVAVTVFCVRPNSFIKHGHEVLKIIKDTIKKKFDTDINITIKEQLRFQSSVRYFAQTVENSMRNRESFARAVKKAAVVAMTNGAKGVAVCAGGRLGGVNISRVEKYVTGRVARNSISENVEYYAHHFKSNYGSIGIRVWINYGKIYKVEKHK